MDAIITKEMAVKAVLLGACRLPEIGSRVSSLSTSDLTWAENVEIIPKEDLLLITDLPLWVLSGPGSGYGDGSGYGYGDGYGDGSGYGYGDGYGDGSGYGSGYGDGYGDGDGYGLIEKALAL